MRDTFEAGKPISEKEFSNAILSKAAGMGSDEFIPWDLQHPELVEGDIMPTGKKNAIINSNELWPNATIPYVISADFTSAQRQVIAFAMNEYHNKSCIRFVPRTSEANYIRIGKSGQGCWSYVGRIGGGQYVSLDDGCISSRAPGVVIHELMHAAGFWHEHMRPDRDTYVSINLDNVQRKYRGNFDRLSTTYVTTLGLSYDYGSVMHYPRNAFAIDNNIAVITPLIGNPTIGQTTGFSDLDVQKLNKLYSCSTSPCSG
ncbi:zinc metalloproteinase nas-13-like isoform X1 [Daphnia pulicaria]|uniref:zinc metalloproteinase nas-13-like isoform X1 n=1 Tax=Daphnia pulicaria TaxID=35523 RepID=UPI001EECACA7|nr:zinc metalloproteinase nas-13-like isoform X1 [Daphnia pulicaria]